MSDICALTMTLSLDVVIDLGREVAAEQHSGFEVLAVASACGGTDRVELLVAIAGCRHGRCVWMLNLARTTQVQFTGELRAKLRDARHAHDSSG